MQFSADKTAWGSVDMEDINKFIGVPYKSGGESMQGCDCIGLARLFYQAHGWKQDFRDGKPIVAKEDASAWKRLFRYMRVNFEKIEITQLTFGDIVLFEIERDIHFGIYLEYGQMLAMQVPCIDGKTMSTIYRRSWWMPYFKYGYRRK